MNISDKDVSGIQHTSGVTPATSTEIGTNFVVQAPPSVIVQLPNMVEDIGTQIWNKGKGTTGNPFEPIELMYRAAIEGDWAAAEKLLKQDQTLAYREIRGDRPLHVAVALKHKKFAEKLVERMEPRDLELRDSNGYTACCYAAASAMLDISQLMIRKNPALVATRNKNFNFIPLQMAVFSGKSKMISFFLEQTGASCLSRDEWFRLLLDAIATKMYDVALKILEKDDSLATMRNDEGTALHLLAQQDISVVTTGKTAVLLRSIFGSAFHGQQGDEEMQPDHCLLVNNLLGKIRELMDEPSALELLKNPPILHDAAKVGNVDLIRMITRAYNDLILQRDSNNYTLFHIAVMYRQENVFRLIQQMCGLKNFIMCYKDDKDNNILHLAAKNGINVRKNVVSISALRMQRELAWFKEVKEMLPLQLIEMRNKDGKKPIELFTEEHEQLRSDSETWMRNTSDSCMLIATIILTVAYAAAFTVPGGNNGDTGLPVLVNNNWFTCFFIFEALALFNSALCIIAFWSISSSGFEEDHFLYILPYQLKLGLTGLFGSLIAAISAFMSAYYLMLVEPKAWLIKSILLLIYVILVLAIYSRFSELWFKIKLPKSLSRLLS
ncbi:hypothetical protein C2S51_006627 [Perilla frutescens var. frutescens]|nr:hypothetical protein C2S51_006627 [Perilla frutescens var. frutescens]